VDVLNEYDWVNMRGLFVDDAKTFYVTNADRPIVDVKPIPQLVTPDDVRH